MAGFSIPGEVYRDPSTGKWGTAQQHAAWKAEAAPVATPQTQQQQLLATQQNQANTATQQGQYANQTAQSQLQAQQAALAAQAANTNQTNQTQLQAQLAAQAAQEQYKNQTAQTQLQAQLAAQAAANQAKTQKAQAQGSYANQSAQTNLQAELAAKAAQQGQTWKESDRASFIGLMDKGNAAAPPPVSYGGGGGGVAPAEQDARTVAFARAKDQAGKIARASLSSIAENMASRGIAGSGIEALQGAGAIGGAGDALQNLTSNQMISDFNRAGQVDDMRYQGDITQRGQDLANRQSYLSLLRGLY